MNILVIAESGFGKSTSIAPNEALQIKGLNPQETFVVDVSDKGLPTRGWKKMFTEVEGKNLAGGNYLVSNNTLEIAGLIGVLNEKKPEIKNLVIDDLQYLMADYYLAKAEQAGFEKFQKLGAHMGKLFAAIKKFKGNVICTTHPETVQNDHGTTYKAKTVGTMIDRYITIEGKFDIVLYGHQTFDERKKQAVKQFVTNYDGKYPAKSPAGMFELHIPNDLGFVVDQATAYYEGE